MVTYAPHFISVVVLVSLLNVFFGQSTGLVNNLRTLDRVLAIHGQAAVFPAHVRLVGHMAEHGLGHIGRVRDWECVTQDGCAEKRALRLAQGDLPDIFFARR